MEESKEEPKEGTFKKMSKEEMMGVIEEVDTFDLDTEGIDTRILTYVDFLDALVRVAANYPFGDHEEYQTMDQKLGYLVEKLKDKYGPLSDGFIKSLDKKDKELDFPCKMVVNDDSDMEGEYGEGEEEEY